VAVVPDSWTTVIESNFTFAHRVKFFYSTGESVSESQHKLFKDYGRRAELDSQIIGHLRFGM